MRKVKIGITVGDPAGIGPEVTFKALASKDIKNTAEFLIIDTSANKKIKIGKLSAESGKAALENIDIAIELIKSQIIDGLVTAPVSKEAISLVDNKFVGHTEYLAKAFKIDKFVMSFISTHFRLALVTRHLPLKDVSKNIHSDNVYSTISLMSDALKRYFNIKKPSLAVCGLNPHAGEGGLLGKEENEVISPAINKAMRKGIKVKGPFPADALFYDILHRKFDAVIAMYHDQGLIPINMIDKFNAVNMTLGLPFVRTSPSHGTAFEIAGKNKANPASMVEAIKLAVKCIHNLKK